MLEEKLSIYSLIVINIVTLITALVLDWSLEVILLMYFLQTLIIGVQTVFRLFSNKDIGYGVSISSKIIVFILKAFFVVVYLHIYGAVVLFLGVFLLTTIDVSGALLAEGFWIVFFGYVINHVVSFFVKSSSKSFMRLAGMSFARAVPMVVLLVVFSIFFADSKWVVVVLVISKSALDIWSHYLYHKEPEAGSITHLVERGPDNIEMYKKRYNDYLAEYGDKPATDISVFGYNVYQSKKTVREANEEMIEKMRASGRLHKDW